SRGGRVIRLIADSNLSRHFVKACLRLDQKFPIVHIADWSGGKHRISKDPIVLEVLREKDLILVTVDRRTMAVHAGKLSARVGGHTGVVLCRRSVSQMDYGKQSRLVVE